MSSTEVPRRLSGVAGWLAFLCIILILLGPGLFVFQVFMTWQELQELASRFPAFLSLFFVLTSVDAILVLLGFVAGILLLRGRATGVQLALIYFSLQIVWTVIASLVMIYGPDWPPIAQRAMTEETLKTGARSIGNCLIWILYLRRSVRVKNTYGSKDELTNA